MKIKNKKHTVWIRRLVNFIIIHTTHKKGANGYTGYWKYLGTLGTLGTQLMKHICLKCPVSLETLYAMLHFSIIPNSMPGKK